MHGFIPRTLQACVHDALSQFPAVALLGPRQCGKSTLARALLARQDQPRYLDLERPSDLRKLTDPELYFQTVDDALVCLDEIQRAPDLFPALRSILDARELRDTEANQAWVVAPVQESWPIAKNVTVTNLPGVLAGLLTEA